MAKLSKDAIKVLRRVQKHVLAEPKRLDMGDWLVIGTKEYLKDRGLKAPACGTVGCIAGWVATMCHPKDKNLMNKAVGRIAARDLGLDDFQRAELFIPADEIGIYSSPQTKKHAVAVCKHIDKFIEKYK